MDIVAVITLEERHDESWGAVAALGTVALGHFPLHGMKSLTGRDAFDADDFTPRHQAEWHEATVDGAITRLPLRVAVNHDDRARAAIALSATFLPAGQAGAARSEEH